MRKIKAVSSTASAKVLTLDDIRNSHKSNISQAYIEELGGLVCYRNVAASVALGFMEDDISRAEQIRAMARFMSESLCNEDGTEFISYEDTIATFPLETIQNIVMGISAARNKDKESKNASRR